MELARRLAYRSRSVSRIQSRYGSSAANSAGSCIGVLLDVVGGHLVQVAEEDLLVVEGEVGDDPAPEHRLGGLQRVGVLEGVLLERHPGDLVRQPLAGRL